MIIRSPDPEPKTVIDYHFMFTNGAELEVTLDYSRGDSIDFKPDSVVIHIEGMPYLDDPTKSLPARDITLFKDKIISHQRVAREIQLLPDSASSDWLKALKTSTKSVQ
jgi:hypothetical protein